MFSHLLIYLLSFVGIWVGSGLAIKSVERLSRSLKVSQFAVSFLVLGLFTSISELSVGVNSIIANDPEIFVGNLIGASIVLFMFIIPLLALTRRSIPIKAEFQGGNLLASLVVISLPGILALDGKIGKFESIIAVVLFVALMVRIQQKRGFLEKIKVIQQKSGLTVGKELLKMCAGLVMIFVASKYVVEQTLFFSTQLHVSPFLISLLVIAVGTNIPELSLVVRSLFLRNNQVAFGDYIGSAAWNTFLLGMLTLVYGKPIYLTNSYVVSLLFLILGLVLFYFFARSKHAVSRIEGAVLLMMYGLFLFVEVLLHKNILHWGV